MPRKAKSRLSHRKGKGRVRKQPTNTRVITDGARVKFSIPSPRVLGSGDSSTSPKKRSKRWPAYEPYFRLQCKNTQEEKMRIPETVAYKIFSDSSVLVLPSKSWSVHTLLDDCVVYFELAATCDGNVIMTKKFIVCKESLTCFVMERPYHIKMTFGHNGIETIVDLQSVLDGFNDLCV